MTVPTVTGWLTIPQAAKASQVSERTLRREIAERRLVACRIGRCVRVRPDDLEAWMDSRRVAS